MVFKFNVVNIYWDVFMGFFGNVFIGIYYMVIRFYGVVWIGVFCFWLVVVMWKMFFNVFYGMYKFILFDNYLWSVGGFNGIDIN